jgi:DNA modification methylase
MPEAKTKRLRQAAVKIRIDPAFHRLIPPLLPEEREQLLENLRRDGCREPLTTWGRTGIILDGHNRFELCTEHGIYFTTTSIELSDRTAAEDWIDANQLGRRNLTPDQRTLLIGRRYNRAKKKQGGRSDRQLWGGQNVHPKTAEAIAKEHNIDEKTVRRAGQFAESVEAVKKLDPEIEQKVIAGSAPPKARVIRAASLLDSNPKKAEAVLHKKISLAQADRDVARELRRKEMVKKAAAATASAPDQLWRMIHGDCAVELERFKSSTIPLIFADPPYNIGIDYGGGAKADRLPDEKYVAWCAGWIAQCVRLLRPNGSFWLLIGDEYAAHLRLALGAAGLYVRAWIKWYETFGVNCSNNFNRCSRHLFYCVKHPKQFIFNAEAVMRQSDRQAMNDPRADPAGKIWDNVWEIPRLVENAKERIPDFPTQLPLALMEPIIGCASDPGDEVLDPMAGSATTGVACLNLGRRFIGIEKNKRFHQLAVLRLQGAQ